LLALPSDPEPAGFATFVGLSDPASSPTDPAGPASVCTGVFDECLFRLFVHSAKRTLLSHLSTRGHMQRKLAWYHNRLTRNQDQPITRCTQLPLFITARGSARLECCSVCNRHDADRKVHQELPS